MTRRMWSYLLRTQSDTSVNLAQYCSVLINRLLIIINYLLICCSNKYICGLEENLNGRLEFIGLLKGLEETLEKLAKLVSKFCCIITELFKLNISLEWWIHWLHYLDASWIHSSKPKEIIILSKTIPFLEILLNTFWSFEWIARWF